MYINMSLCTFFHGLLVYEHLLNSRRIISFSSVVSFYSHNVPRLLLPVISISLRNICLLLFFSHIRTKLLFRNDHLNLIQS